MEENKYEEPISIIFKLKSPTNFRESSFNTLIHALRDIKDLEECPSWSKIDRFVVNDRIEVIKRELENLKIIEILED